MNSNVHFYSGTISPKSSSVLNTHTNYLIHRHIEHMILRKRKNRVAVRRGDGGVAGEGRVVVVAKFHSWGKCTSH